MTSQTIVRRLMALPKLLINTIITKCYQDQGKYTNESITYFTTVNDKDIEKLMQKMDPKNTQGYDNIPSKLLRLGASGISSHLSQLVNYCLHVCEFPDIMKLADVSSLSEKNYNSKKDNFRLVSILPSRSKVYERVMGKQLRYFR